METLILVGLLLFSAYTLVLVSVVLYDILTGRINRLRGIANKGAGSASSLQPQRKS